MSSITLPYTQIAGLLRQRHGVDFSAYQPAYLARRLRHRMAQLGIADESLYLDYLGQIAGEADQLFGALLINHTAFFRDPEVWQLLADEIIPAILQRKSPHEPLRLWSAGCATGQEAYSLAILLAEALGPAQAAARVTIFATDVDPDALQQAGAARYHAWAVRHVPAALLSRYFVQEDRHHRVCEQLRHSVVVQRHNLIDDEPIGEIDLLLCRNTLLYFTAATQGRVLAQLDAALAPSGVLVLGKAETTLYHSGAFRWLDRQCGVAASQPQLIPAPPAARAADAAAPELWARSC